MSSTGNDAYDPTIANTGMNGTSQGSYEMRVNFRPGVTHTPSVFQLPLNQHNVAIHVEREIPSAISPDTNGTIGTAEVIGALAANQKSGDENLRLGFEIHGFVDNNADVDVYDSTGRLILIGGDSNIADDQPGPLEGTDMDDLSRGSVGKFDPYIGTVELPGGVYTVAVSNNLVVPQALDQFWFAASSNPLVRLEPINLVNRIAEERFGSTTGDLLTTANRPTTWAM